MNIPAVEGRGGTSLGERSMYPCGVIIVSTLLFHSNDVLERECMLLVGHEKPQTQVEDGRCGPATSFLSSLSFTSNHLH